MEKTEIKLREEIKENDEWFHINIIGINKYKGMRQSKKN